MLINGQFLTLMVWMSTKFFSLSSHRPKELAFSRSKSLSKRTTLTTSSTTNWLLSPRRKTTVRWKLELPHSWELQMYSTLAKKPLLSISIRHVNRLKRKIKFCWTDSRRQTRSSARSTRKTSRPGPAQRWTALSLPLLCATKMNSALLHLLIVVQNWWKLSQKLVKLLPLLIQRNKSLKRSVITELKKTLQSQRKLIALRLRLSQKWLRKK